MALETADAWRREGGAAEGKSPEGGSEARPMGGAGELKGEPVGRADGGCES